MPLDQTLANVPGLGGALAMREYRRQQQSDQVSDVSNVLRLQDAFRQQGEMQKVRDLLQNEKDPEKLIPALAAIGPTGGQYAQHYAAALQAAQNYKFSKQFENGSIDPNNMTPDQLESLGQRMSLTGHAGGAALVSLADRRRKLESDKATYETMKRGPSGDGGLFSSLMGSEFPQISSQARILQDRLEQSDPRSVPPQYWENMQQRLASQEGQFHQAKSMKQFAFDLQKGDPETIDNNAQLIAKYKLPPLSAFAMKSPWGQSVMNRVAQINPDYDGTQYSMRSQTVNAFAKGKQGDQVRAFNVGLAHLDTLGQLNDALGNGDVKQVNRLAQMWKEQMGDEAPTDFDSAKEIVANEIVKAIVGAGGGVTDRNKAQDELNRAKSPAQLKGVIETYKSLFGGQLYGLRRQYEHGTMLMDFDDLLSPEGREVAKKYEPKGGEQAASAPPQPSKPLAQMNNAEYAAYKREVAAWKAKNK